MILASTFRARRDHVQINSVLLMNLLACYCDTYCDLFQDCCYDYWSACNANKHTKSTTKLEDDSLRSRSCVSLGDTSYWMKNKCSKSWTHDEVKPLCINPLPRLNSSTYLDFFPVLGIHDNITYRNRHCARCTYQNNFDFWEVSALSKVEPIDVRSVGDLIDFLLEFTFVNVVPTSEMHRRYCLKPVSNCSRFHTSGKLAYDKCVAGSVALVVGGQINIIQE